MSERINPVALYGLADIALPMAAMNFKPSWLAFNKKKENEDVSLDNAALIVNVVSLKDSTRTTHNLGCRTQKTKPKKNKL